MVQTGTGDPHQLMTRINGRRIGPLVVAPIPLLRTLLHLSCIVGSQGEVLQTMTSGHGTGRNEVVQRQTIKGTKCTPQTLNSLVYRLSRRISPVQIISSSPSVLDVEATLELLKAFRLSVVDILGVGNELRRRRSVGSRHFVWRTG